MKTRLVEVMRIWYDGTWDTEYAEIPADTTDEDIARIACDTMRKMVADGPDILIDCSVYYVPEMEDEDD